MVKNLIILGLSLALAGCAYVPPKGARPFVNPQYGMTKMQMVQVLGMPYRQEIYKRPDQTRVEFDMYIRRFQSSQQLVPVCVVDNKVVGWGKTFYEDHVSENDVRIK